MDLAQPHDANKYYIPNPSPWPIIGAVSLFTMMLGAVSYLNDFSGAWSFLPGAALLIFMFSGWFHTVIGESQHGTFNVQVDKSFRMGMMWFIFSEVMFFVAFFGALFYARRLSVPWLGGEGVKIFNNIVLWPGFESTGRRTARRHVGGRADSTFRPSPHSAFPRSTRRSC